MNWQAVLQERIEKWDGQSACCSCVCQRGEVELVLRWEIAELGNIEQ